jgi:hypothetical protein
MCGQGWAWNPAVLPRLKVQGRPEFHYGVRRVKIRGPTTVSHASEHAGAGDLDRFLSLTSRLCAPQVIMACFSEPEALKVTATRAKERLVGMVRARGPVPPT